MFLKYPKFPSNVPEVPDVPEVPWVSENCLAKYVLHLPNNFMVGTFTEDP